MLTNRPGLRQGEKIMVAMSGGLDSSVAALLVKKAGYQPVGATLRLWVDPYAKEKAVTRSWRGSPSDAVSEARSVARALNIPHYVFDMQEAFYKHVVCYFSEEYLKGRTPNPCLACNRQIKFSLLMQKARTMGINYLATGHYARICYEPTTKRFRLLKGVDSEKDQSYMLFTLNQEQLSALIFPLGNLFKQDVRDLALKAGLKVAQKDESQEICFIPDNDYRGFLKRRNPQAFIPGDIISVSGKKLGRHKGLAFYTIGQRKGLGLTSAVPLYVTRIDTKKNLLVVGEEEHTYSKGLIAEELSFVSGIQPAETYKAEVKIRYRSSPVPATLFPPTGSSMKLFFKTAQKAVTPGQAAVFYAGEEVLGGGIICAPIPLY
jgi:tRNA-specific 2-thiouridylase